MPLERQPAQPLSSTWLIKGGPAQQMTSSPLLGPGGSRNGIRIEKSQIHFEDGVFSSRSHLPHLELAGSCRDEQSAVFIPIRPLKIA